MSMILGIGDEVAWFAVATLIILLFLSVSFLWRSPVIQQSSHSQETISSPAENLHEEISPSVSEGNHSPCDRRPDRSSTLATCTNDVTNGTTEDNNRIEEVNSNNGDEDEIVVVENCCVKNKAGHDKNDMSSLNDPSCEKKFQQLSNSPKVVKRTVTSESNNTEAASTSLPVGNDNGSSDSGPTVSETEQLYPDQVTVRIKYLNDMERTVSTRLSRTIADFKRDNFSEELAANKTVRLIFNGQLLRNEVALQQCGVSDGCVIHVHISQSDPHQPPTTVDSNVDLDLSHLLWPLLSIILCLLWILYFKYPQFFNVTSTGILLIFTGGFIVVYGYGENRVHIHN